MPDLNRSRRGRRTAGDDYRDALARLIAGTPSDKSLLKKARAGKLRISVSSVALEARRARSPIAIDDPESLYHDIHLAIVKAAGSVPDDAGPARKGRLPLHAVVTNLRRDLKKLTTERDLYALKAADAVDAAQDFERRALVAEKHLRNLRREAEGRPPRDSPIPPKPKGPRPDNILKFPRDR